MAVAQLFTDQNIMALLKIVYRDGIESNIYRNSPVLPKIDQLKIDGREYRWACTFAASPTASFDYNVSKAMATKTGQNGEWISVAARQFATCTISQKEFKASRTGKGAYGRILGNKIFQTLEGLRKQAAKVLYSVGYGEFATYQGANWTPVVPAIPLSPVPAETLTLPESSTIALMPGMQFRVMKGGNPANIQPAVGANPYVVGVVDETWISLDPTSSTTGTIAAGDVLIYDGAVDAAGQWHAPQGLKWWILNRNGTTYQQLLADTSKGVDRRRAPGNLGGQFYAAASTEKIFDAIMKGLRRARRAGGDPNLVIMNDEDAAAAIAQYETIRTQFLGTDTKRAGTFRGANSANFVLWSSVLEKVVDDPYLDKGGVFILEKENFSIIQMSDLDRVVSQNAGTEEPGRADPLADDGEDIGLYGDKLVIDEFFSIEDGVSTGDGAVKLIGCNMFYNYALFNTAGSCYVDISAITY